MRFHSIDDIVTSLPNLVQNLNNSLKSVTVYLLGTARSIFKDDFCCRLKFVEFFN